MKVAFIYSAAFFGTKRYSFSNIWDNPEGLTGSELSYLRTAIGMQRKGHEVHLYTLFHGSCSSWENLHVHDIGELNGKRFDVAISWNDTEPLKLVHPKSLRIVSIQINDFGHCSPNVEDYVDIWISPSEPHRVWMTESNQNMGLNYGITDKFYDPSYIPKWKILHHGCDLENYDGVEKVPGRVIWASSPDRGLHLLLQEWTKIKDAVPGAHLRIFYRLDPWIKGLLAFTTAPPQVLEQKSRALYINEAIKRLDGIEVFDSVSRRRIDKEMAEAEVLAYPCHPVRWTEGFSVTLMESCAARACPITTAVDALPNVYGGAIPMIDPPVRERMNDFSDLVIRALLDPEYRENVNKKVRALAETHTWDKIVDNLETIIGDHSVK